MLKCPGECPEYEKGTIIVAPLSKKYYLGFRPLPCFYSPLHPMLCMGIFADKRNFGIPSLVCVS